MKKFKYMMLILVCSLFFVGKASAETQCDYYFKGDEYSIKPCKVTVFSMSGQKISVTGCESNYFGGTFENKLTASHFYVNGVFTCPEVHFNYQELNGVGYITVASEASKATSTALEGAGGVISATPGASSSEPGGNGSVPIKSDQQIKQELTESVSVAADDRELSTGCGILGPKIVAELSWFIKIFRLGIPILVIILGMLDFLKILFSGEDKVYKDAFLKFVKRLIIGVVIIFIPYIIQGMVKLTGIETQYGIDNFYCGILEGSGAKPLSPTKADDYQCYVCDSAEGNRYWMYQVEEPKGYASCFTVPANNDYSCLHG